MDSFFFYLTACLSPFIGVSVKYHGQSIEISSLKRLLISLTISLTTGLPRDGSTQIYSVANTRADSIDR